MSVYVSLACREYVEGRICLTSDKLSGFITNHGFCSRKLWRNVLEWTGQKFPEEIINVGVVVSTPIPTLDYLATFGMISYRVLTIEDLSGDLSGIDILYFIGLPVSDISDVMEEYVRYGGGILIECPDKVGTINVLEDIETINITSIERPSYEISYWTEDGVDHPIYSNDAIVYFYSTLELNSFSNWTILMSSVKNESLISNVTGGGNVYVPTTSSATSEFGISYENYYKNGIVYLNEVMVDGKPVVSSSEYHSFGEKVYSAQNIDRIYGVFTSNIIIASDEFLNWHNLTWVGQNNVNTRVFFFVRSSATQDGLSASSWIGPYQNPSNDISSLTGRYLQFMAVLRNDGDNVSLPLIEKINISFFSLQQSTKFFTKAFDLNFVPKHILLTYNASNVDDNTVIRFAVSGEDTVDETRYKYIDPNKIETLDVISYDSSKVKIMLEFIGNSSVPVSINEFAFMLGGDEVEPVNFVSNVAPVVTYLVSEDGEYYLITEDGEYIIAE